MLTNANFGVILFKHLREWRNRQTRTFEGRVVIPYGFKSRLSHQTPPFSWWSFYLFSAVFSYEKTNRNSLVYKELRFNHYSSVSELLKSNSPFLFALIILFNIVRFKKIFSTQNLTNIHFIPFSEKIL